jgi:hypothetical protein
MAPGGGGFVVMLAASAVLIGSFLVSFPQLQNVLGTGARETGYETRADACARAVRRCLHAACRVVPKLWNGVAGSIGRPGFCGCMVGVALASR